MKSLTNSLTIYTDRVISSFATVITVVAETLEFALFAFPVVIIGGFFYMLFEGFDSCLTARALTNYEAKFPSK